ncbi:MAG: helix-turn-helix domain-containing protein [Pseudomonadota bacterium]|nr:helix-turn-helix domain-containing protein [Pseudomonadota bacterium]
MSAGRDLRDARTRMGITVQEAAARARIPQRYLEALERDDLSVFGRGPFAAGYTRQYRRFLSLPDAPLPVVGADAEPEQTLPTQTAPIIPSRPRLLALAGAVGVVLILATLVGRSAMDETEPEVGVPPDQIVLLTTGEPLRATIVADGREVFSGNLAAGQQQRFEAHERLELDLARLNGVSVVYNGRTLKPLGAQSRPRRLVFIDDRGK